MMRSSMQLWKVTGLQFLFGLIYFWADKQHLFATTHFFKFSHVDCPFLLSLHIFCYFNLHFFFSEKLIQS